ncbi:helix-turn-helix transcriptional regulator [Mycobacterium ahvazicum]|uniref:helix-turn-helix transcriptional regulator n=1 Tax=Mycobacterium ahvazicum TaxID=1964395 RepID=UPI000BB8BE92|nr:DNA-binding protein [Mycobacterium ahvazicum]
MKASPTSIPVEIDTALPGQVAPVLGTTEAGLAQMRYRGTGPRFVKVGRKVVYRWSDVRTYLEANTVQRTDDPRGVGVA